jgi:hypothetical protein
MTPAEAADVVEIQQLAHRYAWAIDQRDFDLLDRVFVAGAEIHYNVWGGTTIRWPEGREWLRQGLSLHRVTQHNMGNTLVDLDGDRARGRTYGQLMHVQELPDGKPHYLVQHAIYSDELVRTAAGWRIAKRTLDNLFVQGRFLGPAQVTRYEKPKAY